jgi:hypothetical protein
LANTPTKDWQLYEAGVKYNNSQDPNYYETVNANWDFFAGNQWRGLPESDMPKPVFNIIKRVITFFVASLTSSKAKIHFEPMMYDKDNPDPSRQNDAAGAEIANKVINNLFEKWKMEFRIKDALFDAAVSGDMAAHFYWDQSKKPYGSMRPEIKGDICFELIDGTDVFLGNANTSSMDVQPYVIVRGRDTVKRLQEEAEDYGQNPSDIKSDKNYENSPGNYSKIEVEGDESGKAEYIIVYRKVKKTKKTVDQLTGAELDEEYDTIVASKSTEGAYIFKDEDLGLSVYPVAFNNWEKQKGTYHGRAIATGVLPNQIFINRMFAFVMYHLMRTAFPKAVYNADLLEQWDDAVGSAIGVSGADLNTPLANIATYLQPGNMSAQIMQVLEIAMQYTKEMLGASDGALGNVDPKNTSAIIAVSKAAAVPLENPKSNLYEWIEDIGRIVFDMAGTHYGPRPVMQEVPVVDPMTGQQTIQMKMVDYDFSQFKDLWLDIRANVGESSYWSEIAVSQTLDNLLAQGHIDIIQYLERQPADMIPQKEELIADLQQKIQAQQAMMQQQQQMAAQQQQGMQQQTMQEQLLAQQAAEQAAHHKRNDAQQKMQHDTAMKHLDIAGKLALAQATAKK